MPNEPGEAAHLALNLLLALCLWARDRSALRPLPVVLMLLAGPTRRPRTREELGEAWYRHPTNSTGYRPLAPRPSTDAELGRCLTVFGDTGLWLQGREELLGTELGLDFCRALLAAIDGDFFCSPDAVDWRG